MRAVEPVPSAVPAAGAEAPWRSGAPLPPSGTRHALILVEGSSFMVSDRSGDLHPGGPEGLFVLDTRVLSRWELRVDGRPVELLTSVPVAPFEVRLVARARPTDTERTVVVDRTRVIGDGMREVVSVENHTSAPQSVTVQLHVDVDFADVFEVKESRTRRHRLRAVRFEPRRVRFESGEGGPVTASELRFSLPATVEAGRLSWELELPARSAERLEVELVVEADDRVLEPAPARGAATPADRYTSWKASTPVIDTDDPRLRRAVAQSIEDLGALRIFDPEHPGSPVIAAGAPWFMTLFGRDALLAAWMALPLDPTLAVGVLETLARRQGRVVDEVTEEQPGRILHEVRFGRARSLALGGASAYYGSVDATPLFVVLAGELCRWGLAPEAVHALMPHVDRAMAWIETHGDLDGDGFVEYRRTNPDGLVNQGWKDSWDGIAFADGRLAEPPIALCEVQGYVYAALVARADLALAAGDEAGHRRYRDAAERLREAFHRAFWLPEQGWYALGLDGDKRPIDALASNAGHLLWTGIVDDEHAARVAERLVSPELFTGWGIRTLATSMGRYDPVSYHNGSVWPHDSAICAAGLMRYGHVEAAHRVIEGLLDTAAAMGGRLPELFAGFDRRHLGVPADYPTSCSPQAWAAAAPLLIVRSLLRLEPWVPGGCVWLAPALPAGIGRITLRGVELAGERTEVEVTAGSVRVSGLRGLTLVEEPMPPLGPPGR